MAKKKNRERTYSEEIIIEHVDTNEAEAAANEIASKGYDLFSAHTSASEYGNLYQMVLVSEESDSSETIETRDSTLNFLSLFNIE